MTLINPMKTALESAKLSNNGRLVETAMNAVEKHGAEKIFDVFLGRIDGWHTSRVAQSVSDKVVSEWIKNGYRIETEHQIGVRLHEVYLVKV